MVDLTTIAALAGLVLPLYAALYQIGKTLGRVAKATEHNEQAVEDISTKVDRVETALVREPEIELSP